MEVLRDFVAHYLDFILSPSVFLALALVSPVIFLIYQDSKTPSRLTSRSEVPGCRRFGLAAGEPSYLRDQYSISTRGSHPSTGKVRVKALFTYPVKSGRGVELRVSEVESVGLRYDRLFSFAQLIPAKAGSGKEGQDEWRFITQREFPRLALLSTELWLPDPRQPSSTDTTATPRDSRGTPRRRSLRSIPGTTSSLNGSDPVNDWHANDGCLIIRFPYDPDFNPFGLRSRTVTIRLPLSPTPERAEAKRYQYQELSIWKDRPMAINMSTEIPTDLMAKLKEVLWVRAPLALFRVDDDHHRTVSRNLPEEFADRFKVKLADSYPLHILNLASVRDIDGRLPDRAAFKGRLDARRFRANIYIEGEYRPMSLCVRSEALADLVV